MKETGLIHQVRQAAHENSRIFVPGERSSRNWPLCLTCGRDVDEAKLENLNHESLEIKVRCRHLAPDSTSVEIERAFAFEDSVKIKFPFRLDNVDPHKDERVQTHIRRAMGDFCAFDPTRPSK